MSIKISCKEEKVIVKRYANEKFEGSVVIPTAYYPLNGAYRVFTKENSEMIKDEKLLSLINHIPYQIGHCYTNTENLSCLLRQNGYEVETYVGWLFVDDQTPVHHCWAVYQNSVIDLADDFTMMFGGKNAENFTNAKSMEEVTELIASFHRYVKEHNIPNSMRCYPIGEPTSFLVYVGARCEPQDGREIYNRLISEYPDHECHGNIDRNGRNRTQRIFSEKGLIN